MSLRVGDKIGPYEIVASIGKGGMGEVFRARDPRLGRDVAIKVSAEKFSERFEREARAIAALNHPNICTLYDVGPNYLVMEHVEGAPPKGPLDLKEALRIAAQVASALEAAHDKGITHRDLKPGNIMVRPDGMVKVLDFGLAKVHRSESSVGDHEATITIGATKAGAILGTPAYMSPEQAKGLPVDKRADLWSFGVVLHELLTGKRVFQGETLTDVLAAVVREDPDFSKVPSEVHRLLQKCLEKDPKYRLRDAGDAMSLVDSAPVPPVSAPESGFGRRGRHFTGWIAAAAALALASFLYFRPVSQLSADPVRLEISVPTTINTAGRNFVLSPDGRKLVLAGVGADGVARLWVRDMDSLEVRALPNTELAINGPPVFWSPDSRFVAYSSLGGQLKKVDLAGSPPVTICDIPVGGLSVSGSWNRDGIILMGSTGAGLWLVRADGGKPEPATTLDETRKETRHAFPTFLPDGRRFVYLRSSSIPENNGVFLGSLDAKPDQQDLRILTATAYGPGLIHSSRDGKFYLLFLRDGTLLAQVMEDDGQLTGDSVPVAQQIGVNIASGLFAVSSDGKLVYRTAGVRTDAALYWFRRQGTVLNVPGQVTDSRELALSPDGGLAVVVRQDPVTVNRDLWMVDFAKSAPTRFTVDPRMAEGPLWFPDGKRILFQSNREGPRSLYQKPSDGSRNEELVYKAGRDVIPTSFSSDGTRVLFTQADAKTKNDVWVLSNPGPSQGERKVEPLLHGDFNESEGRFVPGDAPRWVAYTSDESGRPEVYVRELKPDGARWLVSSAGGANPRWRSDGKELFYAAPDGTVMAVDVTSGASWQASAPRALFKVPSGVLPNWEVSPDGQRFLMLVMVEQGSQNPLTVLLNWESSLGR